MGQSTDAVLMYGYDLGDPEGKMRVAEWDRAEYRLGSPWAERLEGDDRLDEVAGRMLREAGVEGVEVESYCSCDYPMYALVARSITVGRGDVEVLDLAALGSGLDEMDERLARAVAAVGLTPLQERPAWLLASMWC